MKKLRLWEVVTYLKSHSQERLKPGLEPSPQAMLLIILHWRMGSYVELSGARRRSTGVEDEANTGKDTGPGPATANAFRLSLAGWVGQSPGKAYHIPHPEALARSWRLHQKHPLSKIPFQKNTLDFHTCLCFTDYKTNTCSLEKNEKSKNFIKSKFPSRDNQHQIVMYMLSVLFLCTLYIHFPHS